MLTWVVGSGGLLGGAVARATQQRFDGSPVPWTHPAAAVRVLESDLTRFVPQAGSDDWAVVWAAGCGIVGSARPELEAETALVQRFADALRCQRPVGNGAFFLASSAGGVYAGSSSPPFTESTAPHPRSAYGEAKLRQEELVARILRDTVPVTIGRLSNLYGPGQNLAKPQGLVSRVCLAAARHQALNVFVPLDTVRDYLFAEDAAAMIVSLLRLTTRGQPETLVIRNLASRRPTSVAAVLRVVLQIARRPVRIGLGTAPTSGDQVRDLRIASRFSDDVTHVPITALPVGIKRVYEHTLSMLRRPPYAPA
jgi:UDP-glucose 4-epimerase